MFVCLVCFWTIRQKCVYMRKCYFCISKRLVRLCFLMEIVGFSHSGFDFSVRAQVFFLLSVGMWLMFDLKTESDQTIQSQLTTKRFLLLPFFLNQFFRAQTSFSANKPTDVSVKKLKRIQTNFSLTNLCCTQIKLFVDII